MAANRAQGPSRRERDLRARRNERLVVAAAAGVLVLAALVVAAGLFLTQYRPPRAHVLAAGERDYDAGAVVRRALYEMRFGDAVSALDAAVPDTLRRLEDDEVLRSRAPLLVGSVDWIEVRAELIGQVGLDGIEGFADRYAELLRDSGLRREEMEAMVEAQILERRLRDAFAADLGAAGGQALLSRIRLADADAAGDVRRLASEDGADFAAIAAERGSAQAADGLDLGWRPLDALAPAAREAIAPLAAGEVSAVVRDGPFHDVYLVRERDDERPLDDAQRDGIAAERFEAWLAAERGRIETVEDLSAGEERWILDRVIGGLDDARRVASGGTR